MLARLCTQCTVYLVFGLRTIRAETFLLSGCQYSCGTDFPHTMCMSEGTSTHCENLELTPTSRLKDDVLTWHNLYRNELAQGKIAGSYVPNMQKMYWDDDLEKMARIWASQCEPANDRCRKLRRFEVGQNVGVLVGELTPQSSLNTFIRWVNPGPIKKRYFLQPGLVRSHPNSGRLQILKKFFQVIWPDTYLLGCAEATYDRQGLGHRLLVCNYGPSAFDRKNFEKLISTKAPCSCCPEKTSCPRSPSSGHPFPSLCAIPSYETKPGETERIDSAHRTLVQLQKDAGTQIIPGSRDLEAEESESEESRGANETFNQQRRQSAGKSGSRKKYCRLKCNGRMHVMCQPKKRRKFCHERKLIPESKTKSYLLSKFNEIRNLVAGGQEPHLPKASNMRFLVWDKELTKLATTWASTCPVVEDGCRDVERFHVNQIVSLSVSSVNMNKSLAAVSFDNILEAAETFPVKAIGKFNLPEGGSNLRSYLSQILWAKSSRLGCAEILFVSKPSSSSSEQFSSLVCNFGEGGNVRGGTIYRVGEPCSHCPKGTSCSNDELPNLCVKTNN